jgi:hypothetical protein
MNVEFPSGVQVLLVHPPRPTDTTPILAEKFGQAIGSRPFVCDSKNRLHKDCPCEKTQAHGGLSQGTMISEKAALAGTLAAACCCCSDESIFDATHYMRLVENDFKQRSENTMDRAVHQPYRRRWMGAGGENAVAIFDRRF